MRKIVQSIEREFVDTETGEVTKVETSKIYKEKIKEDSFYMTFIDFISPLYKLKSETSRRILTWMCEHAEYNTGVVSLSAASRKEIAELFKITNNSITNSIRTLKELNLISGEKGLFKINPEIFWKGDLKTRRDLLKNNSFKVEFTIDAELNVAKSDSQPNLG